MRVEFFNSLDSVFIEYDAEFFELDLFLQIFIHVGVFEDDVQMVNLWQFFADEFMRFGVDFDIFMHRVVRFLQEGVDVEAVNQVEGVAARVFGA